MRGYYLHAGDHELRVVKQRSSLDLVERIQGCIGLALVVRDGARKDAVGQGKGVHIKAGNNSEVIGTSFESPPEISVLSRIGVDDLSAAENNFKVDDVGAGESTTSEETAESI